MGYSVQSELRRTVDIQQLQERGAHLKTCLWWKMFPNPCRFHHRLMPRITLRRSIFYSAAIATTILFVIALHQQNERHHHQARDDDAAAPPADIVIGEEQALTTTTKWTGADSDADQGVADDGQGEGSEGEKAWFFRDGWVRPEPALVGRRSGKREAKLWPNEDDGDRIVNQLMFVPPEDTEVDNAQSINGTQQTRLKTIVLYHGISSWQPLKAGRSAFLKDHCPVDTCEIVASRSDLESADAILFRDHFSQPHHVRPPNQVWILYLLECPLHTQSFTQLPVFNWTATYRHDSDIVAPYEKFVLFDPNNKVNKIDRDYASEKSGKGQVAWFVSNCGARNERLQYAKDLSKHISVDIFGACGNKHCSRTKANDCFTMLAKHYKFYLSFENSNCKDYITEKFFVNGLGNSVIPIVMGARPEDYKRAAPPNSYIHVDEFQSPKDLADYLHILDNNNTLYNEYFRWKGTGEFINTHFWCRVCALLHDVDSPPKVYNDVSEWWRGKGTCVKGKWNEENESLLDSSTSALVN